MLEAERQRALMVEVQLPRRGIADARVLEAFRHVPREAFLPPELAEFAYADTPLPIGGHTISPPYVTAFAAEALALRGQERVLAIGSSSGYAAAILGRLAREVHTVERIDSVEWRAHGPYDAIAVAAASQLAPVLREHLAVGGRLVMPVGADEASRRLLRITRVSQTEYREEELRPVPFIPLVGERAWPARGAHTNDTTALAALVRENAEPIDDIDTGRIDGLVDRIGDARLVLIGESSHGTSEFYRMRARITRELITRRGFQFVAVEADWPDAARIDDYVLGSKRRSSVRFTPFDRFPSWMWRNEEVHDFVDWLRAYNADQRTNKVGFHGLDLYSLFTSIQAVLAYLDDVDPSAARVARIRYGALTPWQRDPAAYGEAVLAGGYESSEKAVVTMLRELLDKRIDYAAKDGERFFDAAQNARVVASSESYYRAMYYGSVASWNLRDQHMFDTLNLLLGFYGPESKGIVWEHNTHVGDASATEMSTRGEHNVGQLVRQAFGSRAYIIGLGTDHGTVAAASRWDAPMTEMRVRPAHPESYERIFDASGVPAFSLHLREPRRAVLREELLSPRLERAIGVIYRPDTELASHYFSASLAQQFDELVWFDETSAVHTLGGAGRTRSQELPDTYPFGL